MTTEELAALAAEAERLWIIQGQEEEKYKTHLSAWCAANERVRQAKAELEMERRVAERLAALSAQNTGAAA